MPRFSIVLPAYNVAPWVRECIGSVVAAAGTIHCVEILCVDDGSADDTLKILYHCQNEFSRLENLRICIYNQENRGVASARNVALENATGEWLLFLDGDDLLSPTLFDQLEECLKVNSHVEMLRFGQCDFRDEKKPWEKHRDQMICYQYIPEKECLSQAILGPGFTSYAYRRSVVADVRFPDYVLGEDRTFLVRCLVKIVHLVDSGVIGYWARIRSGSATRSSLTVRKVHDRIAYRAEMLSRLDKAHKYVNPKVYRILLNGLFELCSYSIMQLARESRDDLWTCWFKAIDEVENCQIKSSWRRFVWEMIHWSHSRLVAWVLCVCPYKCKLMGFHR